MCDNKQCKDCAELFVNQYSCDATMIEMEMNNMDSAIYKYDWEKTTKDVYTCDVCSDCLMYPLTTMAANTCSLTYTNAPTTAPTSSPTASPTQSPTFNANANMYHVELTGGNYPSELSWFISGGNADSTEISFGYWWDPQPNDMIGPDYGPRTRDVALEPATAYTLTMKDSYGDGWNNAQWTLFDTTNTVVAGPFTFAAGYTSSVAFST